MTGIIVTIMMLMIERTPPNNRTVAIAAETASSLRWSSFIHLPPFDERQFPMKGPNLEFRQ